MGSKDDKNPPPGQQDQQAAPAKRSVTAHAAALYPSAKGGHHVDGVHRPHADAWKHAAAAALHCWAQCAHHTAKDMELSDKDYQEAIAAACKPNAKGIYTPHEPAHFAVPKRKA